MDGLPGMRRALEAGKKEKVAPIKKMVGPLAPTRYNYQQGFTAQQVFFLIVFIFFLFLVFIFIFVSFGLTMATACATIWIKHQLSLVFCFRDRLTDRGTWLRRTLPGDFDATCMRCWWLDGRRLLCIWFLRRDRKCVFGASRCLDMLLISRVL